MIDAEIIFEIEDKAEDEDELVCPECGSEFIYKQGRCTTCSNCGWSKCDL